jgi:hypothetical protein
VNVVEKIATTLGEADKSPLATIDRVVKVLGEEKSLALLEEALKIEAGEGMQPAQPRGSSAYAALSNALRRWKQGNKLK